MTASLQNYIKMLEQELKNIWKNSSQKEKIKFDTSRLLMELDTRMNRFNKGIRGRNIRESIASVYGILLFGYLSYEIPFPLTKIGCVLSVLWFVYLIVKLRNNKHKNSEGDLTSTLGDQLENQKTYMIKEAYLSETVLYWYVLPAFFANVLFIVGFGDPVSYDWSPLIIEKLAELDLLYWLPISLIMKGVYLTTIILFNVFVVWINKRVATKSFAPIIKEIQHMQDQLKSEQCV